MSALSLEFIDASCPPQGGEPEKDGRCVFDAYGFSIWGVAFGSAISSFTSRKSLPVVSPGAGRGFLSSRLFRAAFSNWGRPLTVRLLPFVAVVTGRFSLGAIGANLWRNASPITPSTTRMAPATISQCGYSIADKASVTLSSPSARSRPAGGWLHLTDRIAFSPAGVSPIAVCCFSPRILIQP